MDASFPEHLVPHPACMRKTCSAVPSISPIGDAFENTRAAPISYAMYGCESKRTVDEKQGLVLALVVRCPCQLTVYATPVRVRLAV